MKKEKRTKKIQIHRETLRQLGEVDSKKIAGGYPTTITGGGQIPCPNCPFTRN